MKREQEQSDDIEDRHVNVLESVNHHRINVGTSERIGLEQREGGVDRAEREMSEVINDEREHDQAAHNHVARSPARFHVIPVVIRLGTRAAIFDREQNGEINMQDHGREEGDSDEPEQGTEIAEVLRVTVDPIRSDKDLEVAEQMADDKNEQNHAGHGHDHFSADRRMTKI